MTSKEFDEFKGMLNDAEQYGLLSEVTQDFCVDLVHQYTVKRDPEEISIFEAIEHARNEWDL